MKPTRKTKRSKSSAAQLRRARPRAVPKSTEQVIDLVPRVLGIRRILVPVDFSKPSEKALRYAVSFARQFDAKVSLLHVCPLPYYPNEPGYIPASFPVDDSSQKAMAARLATDARRLVPPGILDRTEVRIGSAYDQICATARKLRADLIIISTHGYTGLKHALLGSTAERVVRHAPCPVLVVRQREREFA